jgi:hypothetical protein
MIISFLIMTLLLAVAYLDERLTKEDPVLGEEWDFTRPNYKKSIDIIK